MYYIRTNKVIGLAFFSKTPTPATFGGCLLKNNYEYSSELLCNFSDEYLYTNHFMPIANTILDNSFCTRYTDTN